MNTPKPLAFRPQPKQLEARIRELSKDDEKVTWGVHAFDRSNERDITIQDGRRILQSGFIKGDIEPGDAAGEWKCKMVKAIKGRREAGVVAIVINNEEIFVKTVEWEDMR